MYDMISGPESICDVGVHDLREGGDNHLAFESVRPAHFQCHSNRTAELTR